MKDFAIPDVDGGGFAGRGVRTRAAGAPRGAPA